MPQNVIGIKDWRNEHAGTGYPLLGLLPVKDFIVDASFIQLDGFIPILVSVSITGNNITLVIRLSGINQEVLIPHADYTDGLSNRIFNSSDNTYIGTLVYGAGVNELFNNFVGETWRVNLSFAASTVIPLSSKNGVYSINNKYGDLNIATGIALSPTMVVNKEKNEYARTIYHKIDGNIIQWSAVAVPDVFRTPKLKTINNHAPLNNDIDIREMGVINILPVAGGLDLSVINSNNIVSSIKYNN